MTPPPFGTFPKIHPFWWGHPSLRSSGDDEGGDDDNVVDNYGKDEDNSDDECLFDERKYQEHLSKGHHKPSKSSGQPLVDSRQCTLILQRSFKYPQCNHQTL